MWISSQLSFAAGSSPCHAPPSAPLRDNALLAAAAAAEQRGTAVAIAGSVPRLVDFVDESYHVLVFDLALSQRLVVIVDRLVLNLHQPLLFCRFTVDRLCARVGVSRSGEGGHVH